MVPLKITLDQWEMFGCLVTQSWNSGKDAFPDTSVDTVSQRTRYEACKLRSDASKIFKYALFLWTDEVL